MVYIRERHPFSLVCTCERLLKSVEVKVDAKRGLSV
jgi:hypothetical protein